MAGTVFRVTNMGGGWAESSAGGSMTEFYACIDCPVDNPEIAHLTALGLPKVGDFHTNPALRFVGTVQSVDRVAEYGPMTYIARVRYGVGGTFNFSVNKGSEASAIMEELELPIITQAGSPPGPYFIVRPRATLKRAAFRRVERRSTLGGLSFHGATDLGRRNVNKLYGYLSFGISNVPVDILGANTLYQLEDVRIYRDQNNQVLVETYFINRRELPAFPAGTFAGQSVDIPELRVFEKYVEDTKNGIVTTADLRIVEGAGENLPWL